MKKNNVKGETMAKESKEVKEKEYAKEFLEVVDEIVEDLKKEETKLSKLDKTDIIEEAKKLLDVDERTFRDVCLIIADKYKIVIPYSVYYDTKVKDVFLKNLESVLE